MHMCSFKISFWFHCMKNNVACILQLAYAFIIKGDCFIIVVTLADVKLTVLLKLISLLFFDIKDVKVTSLFYCFVWH